MDGIQGGDSISECHRCTAQLTSVPTSRRIMAKPPGIGFPEMLGHSDLGEVFHFPGL